MSNFHWGAPNGARPCRPAYIEPMTVAPWKPLDPAQLNFGPPRFSNHGPRNWNGPPPPRGPFPRFRNPSPRFRNPSPNIFSPPWAGASNRRPTGAPPPWCNSHGSEGRGCQNMQKNSKKPRVDKRDLPENNKFYCDICDRGFKLEETYKEHIDGHQQCSVDGCSYTAAPRLVSLHCNMQHRTGLAKKIWQLESKEDVEKWRAERKKNFPTTQVMAEKKAVNAEKIARGEVLETKQFGKFRNNRAGRGRGRKFQKGSELIQTADSRTGNPTQNLQKRQHASDLFDQQMSPNKRVKSKDLEQETKKQAEKQKDLKVDPLSYVLLGGEMGPGDDSEDNQEKGTRSHVTSSDGPIKAEHPHVAGGLGTLIASYGTDSESEDGHVITDTHQGDPEVTQSTHDRPATKSKQSPNDNRNKCRKRKNKRGKKKTKGQGQDAGQGQSATSLLARKSTLLEKLLAPDIRHERNVILQCVRYIVKQRFFGVGAAHNEASDETESRTHTKVTVKDDNSENDDDIQQNAGIESETGNFVKDNVILSNSYTIDDEIWDYELHGVEI